MTCRSADRAAAVAALVGALVLGLVPPASADPTPSPGPSAALTPSPGATATSLEGLSAPVRDFSTVVESIDGSETERASKTRRTVILDSRVLFAEDSARLSGSARARLRSVARQVVEARASGTVRVEGYTDDQGSAAYGLVLSRRRADAVRDVLAPLLAGQGVRITTRGRGEADPRLPNRDRAGREIPENQAKNRRVEITFATG